MLDSLLKGEKQCCGATKLDYTCQSGCWQVQWVQCSSVALRHRLASFWRKHQNLTRPKCPVVSLSSVRVNKLLVWCCYECLLLLLIRCSMILFIYKTFFLLLILFCHCRESSWSIVNYSPETLQSRGHESSHWEIMRF